jgi:2-dehydropantoate 2-reductase
MHDIKTIWVIGLGGVGGYFGGMMAHAISETNDRRQVFFLARGRHLEEIRENGLILQCNGEDMVCLPAAASDNMADFPEPDFCLVCVKSYDLERVVHTLGQYIRQDTVIIPLLNGLDNYQRVRRLLAQGIVLPSCVYVTSHIEKPGKVVQKGPNNWVVLGKDPRFPDFDPGNLLSFAREVGLKFDWKEDPFASIWEKYLLIGSFALITASSGLSMGEVAGAPEAKADLIEVMKEILQLGNRQGIALNMGMIDKIVTMMDNYPKEARSSFQRDLEAGQGRAEVDVFGGTVIRMGRELHCPTPVAERLVRKIEKRFGVEIL